MRIIYGWEQREKRYLLEARFAMLFLNNSKRFEIKTTTLLQLDIHKHLSRNY